jgi:hypothetical protein
MSRRKVVLVVVLLCVVALALAAGGVAWLARPRPVVVTIEVTCTPGVTFKGTADVDGVSRALTGTKTEKFTLEGSRITYSLVSPDDDGEIRVKAAIGEVALGSSGSGNPPNSGVRGWVKSNWGGSPPSHWIESFKKEGDTGWLTPPP